MVMKKFFYSLAAFALICSCTQEPVTPEETPADDQPVASELVTYTFHATADDVKATISDAGAFAWSANDEVAVWNETAGEFVTFTTTGDGNFSATAVPGAVFTTAYYPASIAVAGDPAKVNLAASYTQAEATGGKFFAMTATANGDQLDFTHIASLLKITINDVPASATQLTLSSDATLCGQFTVGTDASSNKIITAGSTASSVSVALSNSAKTDLAFYFPVPTGTYNYTITLGDGTTTMLTQGTSAAKTFNRASFHGLKALTVSYTDKVIIGRYSDGGTTYDWSDAHLISFTPVDNFSGWNKATIGVPDYYVDFKLYNPSGNVYTGKNYGNDDTRSIATTTMPIASDGAGSNIKIFTNKSALDVYYSPSENKLFALPAGEAFVVPVAEADPAVDEYAFIGWCDGNDWNSDYFLEGVSGSNDWRVVRVTTRGDSPHFSFQFRKNGAWSDCVGGIYDYQRSANTIYYAKTTNRADITVYPGSAGDYNVYLKKDLSAVFVLPATAAFSVPTRGEQEDLVSILSVIGGINGTNWDTAYPLEFAAADNHDWYALKNATKISGWGAMVFKLYNGSWGKGVNIGWPSSLDGSIGAMNTIYPLYLRDGDGDIPNIQLGTDGGSVDIYIKADLSQIFTLSHGAAFAVPGA